MHVLDDNDRRDSLRELRKDVNERGHLLIARAKRAGRHRRSRPRIEHFEHLEPRPERAPGKLSASAPPDANRAARKRSAKLGKESRFADAGFPSDQDCPASSRGRRTTPLREMIELRNAPDERLAKDWLGYHRSCFVYLKS